ncbi:MAG: NAD(+) diphosphatase [Rickettsiales bacterium]|nr:NAD(+) diphosphatase [Rickettsiales bacterium]OUV80908.1 MAG: hypothetical protein CBC91_02815 [Rickettsiales bacterium TMED131]|tara:strand:- start:117 stop:983 length:867 start_codon:yes stop_codon:yes gene_type:complete
MKNLNSFSIKNKLNIYEDKVYRSYKCFFIIKNDLVMFNENKFIITSKSLKNFNVKDENTYYLAEKKNICFIGFSITKRQLKKIFKTEKFSLISLRDSISLEHKLLAPYLSALYSLNIWKNNNKYCSKCGVKTSFSSKENSLTCKNLICKMKIYPRLDPTVIILIRHKDKILLARNKNWKQNLYSCIAGFCEFNESLENTVLRETYEEVGLRINKIKYLFSQFWPFSNNLMIGFQAHTNSTKLKINEYEIEDAIWVTKNELKELSQQKKIILPRKYAIAYSLINYWITS